MKISCCKFNITILTDTLLSSLIDLIARLANAFMSCVVHHSVLVSASVGNTSVIRVRVFSESLLTLTVSENISNFMRSGALNLNARVRNSILLVSFNADTLSTFIASSVRVCAIDGETSQRILVIFMTFFADACMIGEHDHTSKRACFLLASYTKVLVPIVASTSSKFVL
jgi:hypothetical protein